MKHLLLIPFIIISIWIISLKISFVKNCSGFLEQTANANSPELALTSLNKALCYIEKHDLTHGYTSLIYKTEADNVEFWYKNIKACQQELQESLNSTQLEKSNVLLKIRESLMETTQEGEKLILPNGIVKYPNNWLWAILITISFSLACIWLFIKLLN